MDIITCPSSEQIETSNECSNFRHFISVQVKCNSMCPSLSIYNPPPTLGLTMEMHMNVHVWSDPLLTPKSLMKDLKKIQH